MTRFSTQALKVKLYQRAFKVANTIQSWPAKLTPPPFRLLQIGSAFWQSRALYVAAELNIADALADQTLSSTALAQHLKLNDDHLYRLLRFLASLGVFEETAPKTFKNSKASQFLRSDHPQSMRAMVLMHNSPEMTAPWLDALASSVQSGAIPFKQVQGEDLFAYLDTHPDLDQLFSKAMSSVEALTGDSFLQDFNWGQFNRLIDIGGSIGQKTLSILQHYPALKALVFDRPPVIAQADWQGKIAPDVLERLSFEGGDFFQAVPAATSDQEAYLCLAIFHALSDTQCSQLLANLKAACRTYKPYLIVGDLVLPEMQADTMQSSFDMQMLVGTAGRERTLSEWQKLFKGSGFKLLEVVEVRSFPKFLVLQRD